MGSDDHASPAFNRGYRDGRDGRDNHREYVPGTFGHYDYAEGYRAALNDARWDAQRRAS